MLKKYIDQCTSHSGVYKMLGPNKEVLYVGKAKNLKARLSSYLKPMSTKLQQLVLNISSIETIPTKTEEEALLLELNLIKKFQPRYNVLLKDDKSFPYIVINERHDFPKIARYRGYKNDTDTYFGPFSSPTKVNGVISALQKAFLLRSCSDTMFRTVTQPCILYQLKRCSAPCVNKISKPDYAKLVQQAKDFLFGKDKNLAKTLTKQMEQASRDLNYEAAVIYRDRIKALSFVNSTIERAKRAELAPKKYANQLYEVQTFFKLPEINRIEIFDNSHTQGSSAVGVMVVFDKDGFNKNEYRIYNIKFSGAPLDTADDYYMMREMLTRRLSKLNVKPDIMIIDGGVGHVAVATQVCSNLGLSDIFIMGLAKGVDRNSGNETIITGAGDKIILSNKDKMKHFLQVLRDEAHRFAITSHRKRRSKALFKSVLDEVEGVGKTRKNALLKHFGSIEKIKAASVGELAKVKGMNLKVAEIVSRALRS